jgi:hypothetical protein
VLEAAGVALFAVLFAKSSGFRLIVGPNFKAGFGGAGVEESEEPEASSVVSNFGFFAGGSSALVVGRRFRSGGTNFFMLRGSGSVS